jgi:endonuclease YncB( thermonuclease family)
LELMHRATLIVLALCISLSAMGETLGGKVVGVTDGDTITVLVAERPNKVRLAEIDTPERGQPWAMKAKQALSDKVFRGRIRQRPDRSRGVSSPI